MIFSSDIFIFLFLPISLAIYLYSYKISKNDTAFPNLILVVISLILYFWVSRELTLVFLFSILVNYSFGRFIHVSKKPSLMLFFGVMINISILFYYKYFNFFIDQLRSFKIVLPYLKFTSNLSILLPIGISFYTLMALSYLIDVYKKRIKPVSLLKFATYLTLFPHLFAGPIVRYDDIGKEINTRKVTFQMIFDGFLRFSWGLGKKVLIADSLGFIVDKIFSLPAGSIPPTLSWIGILVYAFQIYYDFSGYTDMAIGLALFFGFTFPENFNAPFLSRSITEFWQRWHISLSSWLKDYIYFPLGGSRKGTVRAYINTLIVFFLCGLWHGASWTFIVWGIYNAFILMYEKFLRKNFHITSLRILEVIYTYILFSIGLIFVRSPSIEYATAYLKNLFSFASVLNTLGNYHVEYFFSLKSIAMLIFAVMLTYMSLPKIKNKYILGSFALGVLIYSLIIVSQSSVMPFIYIQF
jgi:alginate O-acetyltransferase complex protein AlgI